MKIIEKDNINQEYLSNIFIQELQTPLCVQSATLKCLFEQTKDKMNSKDYNLMGLVLNSCNYLKNLIENYCLLKKIQQKGYKPNYEKFDFRELSNVIKSDFESLSSYYKLSFDFEIKNEIIMRADKFFLFLAIENLLFCTLNNAGKNTSIKVKIRIKKEEIQFFIKTQKPYSVFQDINDFFEFYDFTKYYIAAKTVKNNFAAINNCLMVSMTKEIIHAHFGRFFFQTLTNDANVLGFEMPV